MNERSNEASEKKTYTPLAKPCNFRESWGKSKVNERAQNRNLLSNNVWQPEAGEIDPF